MEEENQQFQKDSFMNIDYVYYNVHNTWLEY